MKYWIRLFIQSVSRTFAFAPVEFGLTVAFIYSWEPLGFADGIGK
jgi:hypothetical protein